MAKLSFRKLYPTFSLKKTLGIGMVAPADAKPVYRRRDFPNMNFRFADLLEPLHSPLLTILFRSSLAALLFLSLLAIRHDQWASTHEKGDLPPSVQAAKRVLRTAAGYVHVAH